MNFIGLKGIGKFKRTVGLTKLLVGHRGMQQ